MGKYDGSASIGAYAARNGRAHFNQLAGWRSNEGFTFSLLLSSHASLTEEIEVGGLRSEELVKAYDDLVAKGDRLSQLGAIEVGLRVLPSMPELEEPIIRLLEQIGDDDVNGQGSSFKLLATLFSSWTESCRDSVCCPTLRHSTGDWRPWRRLR